MRHIYEWILFDADDTLFHFDSFSGLQLMFSSYGVEFTPVDYEAYQLLNKALWVEYQNGAISAEEVQQNRFTLWAKKLQVSAKELNSSFLNAMADICTALPGAERLVNCLKGVYKLGIITNGFTELQQKRLERTGLNDHFELLVISEQVGVAKPHIDIFDHALSVMGNPERHRVLMVGDNPDSDILGGLNAGLDTCWLNTHNRALPEGISPHFIISNLAELEALLLNDPRKQ